MPALYTNAFGSAQNPLSDGGIWVKPGAFSSNSGFQVTGGRVRVAAIAQTQLMRRSGGTAVGNSQYAQLVIASRAANTNEFGIALCIQSDSNCACYILLIDYGATTLTIREMDNGASTVDLLANFGSFSVGNTIRFERSGTSLTAKVNGVTAGSTTDGTLTGGQPGLFGYADTSAANVEGDDYEDGNLGGSLVVPRYRGGLQALLVR